MPAPVVAVPEKPKPVFPPAIDELPVTIHKIQAAVCLIFDVDMHELMSVRRYHDVVKSRHAGYVLARALTKKSFPGIGRAFGRDHSTVCHGIQKWEPVYKQLNSELTAESPLSLWATRIHELMVA